MTTPRRPPRTARAAVRRRLLIAAGTLALVTGVAVLELWASPPTALRGMRRVVVTGLHWMHEHVLTAGGIGVLVTIAGVILPLWWNEHRRRAERRRQKDQPVEPLDDGREIAPRDRRTAQPPDVSASGRVIIEEQHELVARKGRIVPAQLPRDIADFVGRRSELEDLEQRLVSAHDGHRGDGHAVVIAAIAGKPGVGKSAMAIHLAHRLADQFPDGQLYVNLRGAEAER